MIDNGELAFNTSCRTVPDDLLFSVFSECRNIAAAADPLCFRDVFQCSRSSPFCAKCLNAAIISNNTINTGIMLDLQVLLDSPLRSQGLCSGLTLQVNGFLNATMQTCFPGTCDLELWTCANDANCTALAFPLGEAADNICAAGACAGTPGIAFNFSSVLSIGANPVFNTTVQQCAVSVDTMPDLRPVGFPNATGGACKGAVTRCARDPGCWSCLHQFSLVNAGGYPQNVSSALVDTWDNCPPSSTIRQSLVTACDFRIGELGRCFNAFESCLNSTDGLCRRCVANLSAVSPAGADPEHAFDFMRQPACRGLEANGDISGGGPAALTTMLEACTEAEATGALHSFSAGLWCQLEALQCADDPTCSRCLAYFPTGEHVTIKYSPACKNLIQNMTRICDQYSPSYVEFLSCPGAVNINNVLSYITLVVGACSSLVALWVLAVIFGYHKDKRSLRERILIGVFLGNLLYSGVNIMPISLEQTGSNVCGDPVYGREQAIIRGLWFLAKYTSEPPPSPLSLRAHAHHSLAPIPVPLYTWTISMSCTLNLIPLPPPP